MLIPAAPKAPGWFWNSAIQQFSKAEKNNATQQKHKQRWIQHHFQCLSIPLFTVGFYTLGFAEHLGLGHRIAARLLCSVPKITIFPSKITIFPGKISKITFFTGKITIFLGKITIFTHKISIF